MDTPLGPQSSRKQYAVVLMLQMLVHADAGMFGNLQQGRPAAGQGQNGKQQPEEKTWWQKNWLFVVGK
jgi:hypothetical protein